MAERRWQPPPMQPKEESEYAVDDRLLDRVLAVNPHLRRETLKLPRASDAVSGAPAETAGDLGSAISYFASNKARDLAASLKELDARQAQLTAEREETLRRTCDEFVVFLSLLDRAALERSGPALLAKHQAFLDALGVDAAEVIKQIRRGK